MPNCRQRLHNPGGGRIKALHPVIAPPGRNPSINIRLYEQKPVKPEWLLERGMMSSEMMDILRQAMEGGSRILISGGTRTGKTTSAQCLVQFLAYDLAHREDRRPGGNLGRSSDRPDGGSPPAGDWHGCPAVYPGRRSG